jgi:hypothetical protein
VTASAARRSSVVAAPKAGISFPLANRRSSLPVGGPDPAAAPRRAPQRAPRPGRVETNPERLDALQKHLYGAEGGPVPDWHAVCDWRDSRLHQDPPDGRRHARLCQLWPPSRPEAADLVVARPVLLSGLPDPIQGAVVARPQETPHALARDLTA